MKINNPKRESFFEVSIHTIGLRLLCMKKLLDFQYIVILFGFEIFLIVRDSFISHCLFISNSVFYYLYSGMTKFELVRLAKEIFFASCYALDFSSRLRNTI